MKLRIDGDLLIYRAAFAAKDEEPSHAIQCLRCMVNFLLKSLDHENYVIYLSSPDKETNYRYAIDAEYKANRLEKPEHYLVVREYLVKHYKTALTSFGEADDALGADVEKDTVIVSIDKDLMMIPAFHYNFVTKKLIRATDPGKLRLVKTKHGKKLEGVGFKWFCAQMLMGDRIDNVKGLEGFGSVAEYKILNEINDLKELWSTVTLTYAMNNKEDYLPKAADLLWITRTYGQRFAEWREVNLL
jgi:5'-3' exonuclease